MGRRSWRMRWRRAASSRWSATRWPSRRTTRSARAGSPRFSALPFEDEDSERINAAIRVNYRALAKLDRLIGRVVPPVKDSPPFFRPDQAVNTFFFLGAGVGEYKPEVFSWVKGALAVNLDRVSASSLRDRKASWLAGALGAGVCAAIGNVADPGPMACRW